MLLLVICHFKDDDLQSTPRLTDASRLIKVLKLLPLQKWDKDVTVQVTIPRPREEQHWQSVHFHRMVILATPAAVTRYLKTGSMEVSASLHVLPTTWHI